MENNGIQNLGGIPLKYVSLVTVPSLSVDIILYFLALYTKFLSDFGFCK